MSQAAIDVVNSLDTEAARAAFLRCCGSEVWAERMLEARPFLRESDLYEMADEIWWESSQEDWIEAFGHHPRIGDVAGLRQKFAATANWAVGEQSGATGAPEATIEALAQGNREYEAKFGYIFIVCATGKTAGEMLKLLDARLPNDARTELKLAATEQAKITRLRLEKLLKGDA